MKLWLKIGFIIGLIGGLIGDIRLYLMFRAMSKPLGMFGKVEELATFGPSMGGVNLYIYIYLISFLGWFAVSFVIGIIIGFIIEKIKG